ncbi:MAG: hypothetical protein H7Y04_00310 [Verrucomicrobia bacterium]|nr:hypothetical protein [Cytophagales bacterium]
MKNSLIVVMLFMSSVLMIACDYLEPKQEEYIENKPIKKKKRNVGLDNGITDVFDISKDSVFACNRHRSKLFFSADKGKNWRTFNIFLTDFTITDKNVWVAFNHWQGIHEADYCRISISHDAGKKWKVTTLDTEKIFPIKIVSKGFETLRVETANHKIYELIGNDLNKDWLFICDADAPKEVFEVQDFPYSVYDRYERNAKLIKSVDKRVDTLAKLTLCDDANSIIKGTNTVYIAGFGRKTDSDSTFGYYAEVKNDKFVQEHLIPGSYAYLKKTYLNRIYIYGDGGLFIKENNIIKKLLPMQKTL